MSISNAPVHVDADAHAEALGTAADSAYDSEIASYTTSLSSNVTNYKNENGRRYHAYKEGAYILPNDEKESDRLDITHKMIEVSKGNKLYLAPLSNPTRILDIGTGTGIWAMEMGEQFPNCDVLGNDLSPIQPRWVPPNVHFEVDDVEADWTYSQKFDFIHCRCLSNGIKNWPRLFKQCFNNLKPGGYAEFTDFDLTWVSPDGSMPLDWVGKKANNEVIKWTKGVGMEPCNGPLLEGWARDAGFVDIAAVKSPLPVGTWPADKRLKTVGAWNYLQCAEGLEGFFFAIFTRYLGYSKEEVEVMCADIRRGMKDPKMHTMYHLHTVVGKKPGEAEKEEV